MPDSSSWDHQSFVDHAGWIQEHSSAWESHPHIPPHIVTSKHDHGNIDANAGSNIQTSKRIVPTIFTTRSPGIKTEQDGLYVSDGITPSQITSENTQHASTISSVTTNTDIYSGTKPYDLPDVGAAQHEPVPNFFNEHRVFILSIIVASALLLIVAALFLVIIIRRSRKKKMKQISPNSTKAPTGKRARRLVKMESQEHTYEEVEINKKDGITVVGSLDTKPSPAAVENQDIGKSERGHFYFKLDETSDQPATTPVYSTPIMKQKDKIFEKPEISEKTNVHRMYSEPCHFTKTKEEGAKAQENIRYSTPAPTYFLVDPSQYHDIMSAKTTLPRAKLERQRDVTIEKYDQLDRSFKITSSSPSRADDLQKGATGELVTNETGPYNQLNIDQNTAHEAKSSTIVDEQRNEKRVYGLFEAKGYNTLAF